MPKRKEKSVSGAASTTKKNKEDVSDRRNQHGGGDVNKEAQVNWPQRLAVSGSLGKSNSTNPDIELIALESDGIGSHIPHSLKQKYWASEYINIALLLKGTTELNSFCSSSPMVIVEGGIIEARQPICKDNNQTLEKWTDAFLIFMSIHLQQNSDKLQDMMQYITTIRGAATQGTHFGWRTYDEQFRGRLAQAPGKLWAVFNSNL